MINSLKGISHINGKKIMTNDERPMRLDSEGNKLGVDWIKFDEMREEFPICIDHEKDMISFKMLTKPSSEGGDLRNCQLTEFIGVGLQTLKYLNAKFPCRENSMTITKLEEALMWQRERTLNRVVRGVEGKNEK